MRRFAIRVTDGLARFPGMRVEPHGMSIKGTPVPNNDPEVLQARPTATASAPAPVSRDGTTTAQIIPGEGKIATKFFRNTTVTDDVTDRSESGEAKTVRRGGGQGHGRIAPRARNGIY